MFKPEITQYFPVFSLTQCYRSQCIFAENICFGSVDTCLPEFRSVNIAGVPVDVSSNVR